MRRLVSVITALLILCSVLSGIPAAAEEIAGATAVLEEDNVLALPVTVGETAGYQLVLQYRALSGRSVSPRLAITWDHAYDGRESDVFNLSRVWSDVRTGERFREDDYGNEISPTPEEKDAWQTVTFSPQDENWDTGWPLESGMHELHLEMLEENIEIRSAVVEKVTEQISYEAYIAARKAENLPSEAADEPIRQEAELVYEKSHLEVAVSYDRSSPSISPSDPALIRYNILGGSSWSQAGQWVSYQVDVPVSGYYTMEIVYRQRTMSGVNVRRRILIDGSVPFKEFDCLLFPESGSFTPLVPGNGEEPYKVYLTAGQHEIRFEVVLDSLQDVVADFETVLDELNVLSSKINVIVGEGVDLNRDYDFISSIPELPDTLRDAAATLTRIVEQVSENSTDNGSQAARIQESVRLFEKMAERPNDIAGQIDYFRSQLYSLAAVLPAMKTQPIEMDYFTLYPDSSEPVGVSGNIFKTIWFRILAFISSFAGDYTSMNIAEGEDAIDVWISLGRDQAQIMNQLITDDFTPQTGVAVNLSLVTTNIMTAIASGKAPDVVLNLASANIADLYYRDALVDLRQMSNIDEVLTRFYPSAMTSLVYNDAIYALPQTQAFQMVFYRTDVFKTNGYTVPDTWDELYALLSLMQNNGMQMGIGIGEDTFFMMLMQNGVSFFNEDLSAANLTDTAAVAAFGQWTELFTKYGVPKSYDAINRFRSGQMPMIFSDYSFYRTLMVSAPEIANSFAMAPIPGVRTENGVNRTQNSSVTGAVIIKKKAVEDYTAALKFLDWCTSDAVQEKYSFNSEIRVGISARVQTANIAVMDTISWSRSELSALKAQWEQVDQIPKAPAHYYITRNMNNAFRKVVYQYENPRDVIYRYSQEINDELVRKRAELRLGDTQQ